ncbi:MAG TPA: DUF2339 domain-containing protein [Terriglobales bacterium]
MNDRDQSDELQQLRGQVAELTRRVYRLEGLLSARAELAIAPPPQPPTVRDIPAMPAVEPSTNVPPPPLSTVPASIAAKQPARPKASLESRIGGQWLNRVGIVAVLVGLSYFLKLAFENNWIGPATQVLIGIAAGIGLLLWSERFRGKGYPGFAYSLKAVSVGALYLSLWAASQYYHLVPSTVTFLGMVLVTLTSAALSLRQDAELLAAFALVGGFLTPVLISTGQNREFALFCYLALLDLGILWVTAIKQWHRVLLGAYLGTVVLSSAWAATYYTEAQLTPTLLFATFFALLFAIAPFLDRTASGAARDLVIVLVVLNAAGFLAAVYLMLIQFNRSDLGYILGAAALLCLAMSRILERRNRGVYAPAHQALAVGFIAVVIPIKAHGPAISLGWLVEGGMLFWAAHRSRGRMLRILGMAALALGIARLAAVDSELRQPLLLNSRFGLYLVAIAALALLAYYARQEGGDDNRTLAAGAVLALNLLALLALHFEVMDYFQPAAMQNYNSATWRSLNIARDFTYSAVWMIYGSALMLIGFWKRSAFLRWQAIVLLALTAAKVFFYDISALERGYRIVAFIVLGGILLAVSFFYQRSRLKTTD